MLGTILIIVLILLLLGALPSWLIAAGGVTIPAARLDSFSSSLSFWCCSEGCERLLQSPDTMASARRALRGSRRLQTGSVEKDDGVSGRR